MRTDAMFFFICLILCLNQGTIWRRGRRDETKMSGFWKWKYVLQVQLNKNVPQLLLLYFIFTQICARPVLSIICPISYYLESLRQNLHWILFVFSMGKILHWYFTTLFEWSTLFIFSLQSRTSQFRASHKAQSKMRHSRHFYEFSTEERPFIRRNGIKI